MHSIVLIIPYFGKWPIWINLFFDSCRRNYDIDYIFFTDCPIPENDEGSNLVFKHISFTDYCDLVSEQLGIDFHPHRPYKLCDLKPFYGIIHKLEIQNYDFWGFSDIDLVFGNIRKFYTEELLSKYKLLSTHSDRISGHMTIVKNEDSITNQCFAIKNWKTLLQDDNNYALDEFSFSFQFFPESRLPLLIHRKICIHIGWRAGDYFHKRVFQILDNIADGKGYRYKHMNIHPIWSGSDLWQYKAQPDLAKPMVFDVGKNEECLYCHFLPWKGNWNGDFYKVSSNFNVIEITKDGIKDVSSN